MIRPLQERKEMIAPKQEGLSIAQQCILLSLCRSGLYYQARGESALNLRLMRIMDEHYLEHPYKGSRRMYVHVKEDLGLDVSQNRIDRLYYKVMGLRSILPGPHTSKRCKDHKVYPYLLRKLKIVRSNQVWATDITYIPMPKGFMYLMAIIDVHSRCVVHWSLSNTMEASWCAQTLTEAIELNGNPEIINTDQGSQFTSEDFTKVVLGNDIKLSMDGKGRATDNAFIERLWRSVKYEHVYIYAYETANDLYNGLRGYMTYYNEKRRHSSIDNNYPQKVYLDGLEKTQYKKTA
jgi:putative transposase